MGSLCSMNIMASNFQKAITNVKTAYYKTIVPYDDFGAIFLSCENRPVAYMVRGHTSSMILSPGK